MQRGYDDMTSPLNEDGHVPHALFTASNFDLHARVPRIHHPTCYSIVNKTSTTDSVSKGHSVGKFIFIGSADIL